MFESAEVGNKIDKKTYAAEVAKLRPALLDAQRRLAASNFGVAILVSGVEGGGKSETVNLLHEWLDSRGMETHAIWQPTDEERERPFMWRFWRTLPAKGRICIYFGSWYSQPTVEHVFGETTEVELDRTLDQVVAFERMLERENIVLFKYWLHISKADQKKRFEELESDPKTSWRITSRDWKFFKRYDDFRSVSERVLMRTDTAEAPWRIFEGTNWRYRNLEIGRALLHAIESRLALAAKPKAPPSKPVRAKASPANVMNRLDYTRTIGDEEFEEKFERLQGRVSRLTRRLKDAERSLCLVFEGADAAGKGGAIRRLTSSMDARLYQVMSVAAPTDEERAHPYLWRFWRQIPRRGRVTIYDRSWYGRVLVERVEGFCAPADWQRAYNEINAFEDQMTEAGTIVMKFWIAITQEEQLKRFKDREITPYKQYKITEEDWRNRKKWDAYEVAACEMVERTSTKLCPWHLIEGNDKNWSRLQVVRAVAKRLEEVLGEG